MSRTTRATNVQPRKTRKEVPQSHHGAHHHESGIWESRRQTFSDGGQPSPPRLISPGGPNSCYLCPRKLPPFPPPQKINNKSANDPLFDSGPSCLNPVFANTPPLTNLSSPPSSQIPPSPSFPPLRTTSQCQKLHPYPNSKTNYQPLPDKKPKLVKEPPAPPTLTLTSPTSKSDPNSPLTTICKSPHGIHGPTLGKP